MSEEDKKINSFKKYIQFQESTLDDYYKLDEEYFKDQIEQLELSIKLLKNILNLIEKQQKELNNLKEIEKSHKEENGKLRVELEQYKLLEANIDKANKIIAENKFDEGLYGLLMQEKDKNKELQKYEEAYKLLSYGLNNYISKDKIKEKIEELEKEQKEYKNSQEWEIQDDIVAQISILEDLLEEN